MDVGYSKPRIGWLGPRNWSFFSLYFKFSLVVFGHKQWAMGCVLNMLIGFELELYPFFKVWI